MYLPGTSPSDKTVFARADSPWERGILRQVQSIITRNKTLQILSNCYNLIGMSKLSLTRPALILLYGYPGSGKSYFARQLCDEINAAHVNGDRIRNELFEKPRLDRQENNIVTHLMEYMTEEFLNAGISVVFDVNALRFSQRRLLRDMARKTKAHPLLVWLQIDLESAFTRVAKRDRRKIDDRYAMPLDRTSFEQIANAMQNPNATEECIVVSGKHNFTTQRSAIMKKLYDLGLIDTATANIGRAKPGLVNLIPNPMAGRVNNSRRNIVIR
ncbi:ATP-binding protein [Candidatus Saccharibacteria bacterium]|nr:ATP-binding protein [Candidatus Saccharibacteria bacterium]MBI3337966.1 ATP-binding protein [Candidatus Saccharibacteria bacterium]